MWISSLTEITVGPWFSEAQEQLEGFGQRPQGGWSGWRRRLRSSPTLEDLKYLLLRLEEIVFEMGGSSAHASTGHVEEEDENHVNAGASETDGPVPEVNRPTVSQLEDEEELTDGEESSRDSRLWHMPAIRKAWQQEVESAATLSCLVYASQSLCERALQVFEVKSSGKRAARRKRSASAYLNQVESRHNRNESSDEDSGGEVEEEEEEEEEDEDEEEEEEDQEEEEEDDDENEDENEDEEDVSEQIDKAHSEEEESSSKEEEEDQTTSSSESACHSESGSGDGEESSHKSEQQERRGVKRKSRADEMAGGGRRGSKAKSAKPAVSVERWPEVCSKCHKNVKKGKLICCDGDGCTYAIHKGCARLRRVPRGGWLCFNCRGQGPSGNGVAGRRGRHKGAASGNVQVLSRKKAHPQRKDSASGRRAGRGNGSGKSPQIVNDSSSDDDDSSTRKELGAKRNGIIQGCEGSVLAGGKVNGSAARTVEVADDLPSRRRAKRKVDCSEPTTDERASGSKRGRGSEGQPNELPLERSGSINRRSVGAEEKQDLNGMGARIEEPGGVLERRRIT
ncbi:hypothetical protein CBR_g31873 [Chara braunii]|uniref:PHD-type domain-containing protein n=1 Tax=Chara braunii TaxID=69332 RepID=A0A388LFV2_CHABU|nr:hypothetical protein CBR_g31873 [Chara braunii]|eukprot:GBG81200.1 hypothetical protein CBR_g31873 [Chara braunii]